MGDIQGPLNPDNPGGLVPALPPGPLLEQWLSRCASLTASTGVTWAPLNSCTATVPSQIHGISVSRNRAQETVSTCSPDDFFAHLVWESMSIWDNVQSENGLHLQAQKCSQPRHLVFRKHPSKNQQKPWADCLGLKVSARLELHHDYRHTPTTASCTWQNPWRQTLLCRIRLASVTPEVVVKFIGLLHNLYKSGKWRGEEVGCILSLLIRSTFF